MLSLGAWLVCIHYGQCPARGLTPGRRLWLERDLAGGEQGGEGRLKRGMDTRLELGHGSENLAVLCMTGFRVRTGSRGSTNKDVNNPVLLGGSPS